MDETEDLLGGIGIGIHDDIGTDRLEQVMARLVTQLVGLDSYDRSLDAIVLAEQRDDEVDLVGLGDGRQQRGAFDTGLFEHRRMTAVADEDLDIERLTDHPGDRFGPFDEDDIVVLGTEAFGQVPADLATTDDHHVHADSMPGRARSASDHTGRVRGIPLAPVGSLMTPSA